MTVQTFSYLTNLHDSENSMGKNCTNFGKQSLYTTKTVSHPIAGFIISNKVAAYLPHISSFPCLFFSEKDQILTLYHRSLTKWDSLRLDLSTQNLSYFLDLTPPPPLSLSLSLSLSIYISIYLSIFLNLLCPFYSTISKSDSSFLRLVVQIRYLPLPTS